MGTNKERSRGISLSICALGSPCFFYYYRKGDQQLAFSQNWTLISVLIVFPLTMTMQSAFSRREMALVQISTFKANMMSVFLAHLHWDWWVRNEFSLTLTFIFTFYIDMHTVLRHATRKMKCNTCDGILYWYRYVHSGIKSLRIPQSPLPLADMTDYLPNMSSRSTRRSAFS